MKTNAKEPALQFYTKDWRSNMKLRLCTDAARGVWIDTLCVLHQSPEYGVLRLPLKEIARAFNLPLKALRELAAKGVLKGGDRDVSSYTHSIIHANVLGPPITLLESTPGPMWYSSRLVRDKWRRKQQGGDTKFGPDNPPPKARKNQSPDHSPTHRLGDGLGYGAAVAVAVAVPTKNRFPGDENSPASTEPAAKAVAHIPPEPNAMADLTAKILTACTLGKLDNPTADNPVIGRWIASGKFPSHIEQAIAEAARTTEAPKPLTAGYVDPILERIAKRDNEARSGAERRIASTQAQIATQRKAAESAVPRPDHIQLRRTPTGPTLDDELQELGMERLSASESDESIRVRIEETRKLHKG